MKNLRKPFPVLEQYLYFNTAASGLMSEKLLEFRQDHDLDFLVMGSLLKEKQGKMLEKVRESVGSFFNCPPNQVALVPNFSYGFNMLLEGIPESKKVLLLDKDYPSVNHAVISREFEVNFAAIDENLEENIRTAISEHRPEIFAFSIVQYLNGIKLSINFLKKLKAEHPEIIFIADGTQYCGTEIFDFEDSGLDVVIASTYKWLNAGYGNAFMLFHKDMPSKVAPKSSGFNSLQGKYKSAEGNFPGRFEPGHQDTHNFGSLRVALQLLKETGMPLVEERVRLLAEKAKKGLEELELLEMAVVKREHHSSIFNIKGDERMFQFLRSEGVLCSQRGEGIRLSFHYFNTEEELEVLLKILAKYLKK